MSATAENLVVFDDNLEIRAKQLRYRGVGSPYSLLDEIGITPICEFLYRGANIIDLADELNIPITVIHRWIEAKGYASEIDEASRVSAEGYIYQGEKLLREAKDKFQLDKAKAMLDHGRFMASKKDKKQYGNTQEAALPPGGVTYVINVGQPVEAKVVAPVIEGEVVRKDEPVSIAFNLEPTSPANMPPELKRIATKIAPTEPEKEPAKPAADEKLAEQDRWVY